MLRQDSATGMALPVEGKCDSPVGKWGSVLLFCRDSYLDR
jgi:hypothetical protein